MGQDKVEMYVNQYLIQWMMLFQDLTNILSKEVNFLLLEYFFDVNLQFYRGSRRIIIKYSKEIMSFDRILNV
jgi:hypothetical protein